MNGDITVFSYAKINLSIDVTGKRPDGMHTVDMIMQELDFHDKVKISFVEDRKKRGIDIKIKTDKYYLPTDNRNLAWKAAQLMIDRYADRRCGIPEKGRGGGHITINIKKRIPVAGGLAGGSGNGAAVLHGLNAIWELNLGLSELMELGALLGADVPFCVAGQAKNNRVLPPNIRNSPDGFFCARATGTGTELKSVEPLKKAAIIVKPNIGVSTAKVYKGIDNMEISKRPDNDAMEKALADGDWEKIKENMINVLEEYTLSQYALVAKLKEELEKEFPGSPVLMSGSGPTVFVLFDSTREAYKASGIFRRKGYIAYWTSTRR